jgi:hypothetical protein
MLFLGAWGVLMGPITYGKLASSLHIAASLTVHQCNTLSLDRGFRSRQPILAALLSPSTSPSG